MNLYASTEYLQALARVYFPKRGARIGHYRTAGRVFRLLSIEGGPPITAWPFLDFSEPVDPLPPAAEPLAELEYLPRALLKIERAEHRVPSPMVRPSPFVDWSLFPRWADFEALVGSRIGNLLPDSRRKRKKLERDLGPLRFTFDDRQSEPFERCVVWKSAQYRATGVQDMFAHPQHVEMFRELWRVGLLRVSTLFAGETLLAVHLGGLWQGRCYWWVPAYDPAHQKYGPGRLMLQSLMEESHRLGHAEFDFLIGDEEYKWHYATHNRAIGPLGVEPLGQWMEREARAMARRTLERFPRALELARAVRRRLER